MARGRPSKSKEWLKPENIIRVEGWAKDGLTDEEIAVKMEIATSTLYEWKKNYPQFAEALKEGKDYVDRKVENSLLKRALGYEYEETLTEIYEGEDGSKRKHIKKFKKYAHPDVTAQIFWLKNRKQNEWRDKREAVNDTEALDKLDGILNGIINSAERQAE